MFEKSATGCGDILFGLGGTTLGLAAGNTIWLDAAAGWGWFVDPTQVINLMEAFQKSASRALLANYNAPHDLTNAVASTLRDTDPHNIHRSGQVAHRMVGDPPRP